MSRVDYGQVDLELGDETVALKPTLNALVKINKRFGSIREAVSEVQNLNFEAICYVVQEGAGLNPRQADELREAVFRTGLFNVMPQLCDYLTKLMNPTGKDEKDDDQGKA